MTILLVPVLVAGAFGALITAVQIDRRGRAFSFIGVTSEPGPTFTIAVRRGIGPGRRRLFIELAGLIGGPILGLILAGPPGLLAGLAAGILLPRSVRRSRGRRSDEVFEAQLATSVSGIAAALRAGLSLSQAIRFSAEESASPLRQSLEEIVDREALGVPLHVSLGRWSAAKRSTDARLLGSVLRLRLGAGLPIVLDQVARTLRQKESSRREVRSLTAQARLSGAILGLLPIGFFLFLSVTSRHDMAAAYRSPIGFAAIAAGLGLEAGAYVWIRRLLRIAA